MGLFVADIVGDLLAWLVLRVVHVVALGGDYIIVISRCHLFKGASVNRVSSLWQTLENVSLASMVLKGAHRGQRLEAGDIVPGSRSPYARKSSAAGEASRYAGKLRCL